jgi:hypothetical protein
MTRQNSSAAILVLLLFGAARSASAAPGDGLPYVTVTLDGFDRAAIHERAVALTRSDYVFDENGDLVSVDTDIYRFDDLQVRRLTTDGGRKASLSLKASSRYIGWAQFGAAGTDIMAYDLKRGNVLNITNTPGFSEDPFYDLEDNRFVWKFVDFDEMPSEYDVVLSDGRATKTTNESANDAYASVFQDPQTSSGNAAFSALGRDPEDGSVDSEVFFWDGRRLQQVTDDPPIGATGSGYDDGSALVSGEQVVFVTRHPDQNAEPYRIRAYDGRRKQVRTVLSGGTTIVGGHVLDERFCFPIELSGDLLIWNGVIVGSGPVFLLTNIRTGVTESLDDVTGGSVGVAGTADGYVGMFSRATDGEVRVMVYRPKTGSLTTAATYGPSFSSSGVLSISGPNVAYNYFDPNGDVKVAIHYRADEYAKEGRRS